MKKLSECINPELIFLYKNEPVTISFLLEKIKEEKTLAKVLLVDKDSFNKSSKELVVRMAQDLKNKTMKDSYHLKNLLTAEIYIDISKDDVEKTSSGKYQLKTRMK